MNEETTEGVTAPDPLGEARERLLPLIGELRAIGEETALEGKGAPSFRNRVHVALYELQCAAEGN